MFICGIFQVNILILGPFVSMMSGPSPVHPDLASCSYRETLVGHPHLSVRKVGLEDAYNCPRCLLWNNIVLGRDIVTSQLTVIHLAQHVLRWCLSIWNLSFFVFLVSSALLTTYHIIVMTHETILE